MGIQLIPSGTKIQFFEKRFIFFGLSLLLIMVSFGFAMIKGLNYGIDFKGGYIITLRTQTHPDVSDMRSTLAKLNLGEFSLQEFGSDRDLIIKVEQPKGGEDHLQKSIQSIKEALPKDIEYRGIDTVGPKASGELLYNGLTAIFMALLAMLIYIAIRFEWRYGICAIITLTHDCIGVFGLYSVFRQEFNIGGIVAILLIAGYSINDKIVIFDRVRENLSKYKKMPLSELVNLSINETLSRTTLTSMTTFLSLLALYIFGGEVIANYSLPIIIGIVVGTYSSIFVAGPMTAMFNLRARAEKKEQEKQVEVMLP